MAIHHPSGTLLEADALFNLPPTEQYSRQGGLPFWFKFVNGGKTMSPGGSTHERAANSLIKDKEWVPLFQAQGMGRCFVWSG
jgi:hypothetical protein